MTRKKLKWLVLISLTLVWVLTACGGQEDSAASPAAEESPQVQADSKPTAAPTQAGQAASDAPQAATEVQAATTVQQAAQLIDLRSLPLPDDAQPMGQVEAGYLNYQVPGQVATVVDFYRSLLADEGWQENSEQGYADETNAALYFTKEGFNLSLSASQTGEGNIMVTLINLGNIDLRALPQMANAETGFYAPNTLIYFSPTGAPAVADFTRTELAAQGWLEYTRPGTASASNADQQILAFIQNGLELTAFISVAPAQDNKTSVQYSLLMLPLDLPVDPQAASLEFDKTEPYLSYRTPTALESLVEVYREQMAGLGWNELPESGTVSPQEAALVFASDEQQLALILNLSVSDGQTVATLQPFAADTPLASTEAAPETDVQISGDMPNVPLPDDAQSVNYDPDLAEITFTSASDVAALVEFYRQALSAQGWQADEDFAVVSDTFASIDFSQGDDTLTLTLFDLSGSTEASLDLSGAASLAGSAAPAGTGSMSPPANAPTYTINDWPVPPEAFNVNLSGDTLSYKIPKSLAEVAEFYRPTFEMMELGTDCLDKAAEYTSMSCGLSNGDFSLNFFAYESGDNQTEVEINFVNYAFPSDESSSSGGDSGELSAVDQDGLPLPSNYTNFLSEDSQFSRRLTFTSPSDAQTLLEFYQAELANLGWQQAGDVATTGEVSTLAFEGSDGNLTLTIKPAGSETEVTLVSKNPTAAAEAGILPPAGQARLYLVNFSSDPLTVLINDQTINLEAEAGMDSPDTAGKLDLRPNTYKITIKAGSSSVTDEITLGPDETWSLLLDASGVAPLQMY